MELTLSEKKIENFLQQEIIHVLKKEKDVPEKYTILGSDINQIRHIFYYLKSQKVPIRVYYALDSYTGFITNVEDIIGEIDIVGFEETSHRRLTLSFNFMNNLYQFEVTIYNVSKDRILFYLPLNIQYISRRKYPRFFPEQLYAQINIEFQKLFSQVVYEQLFHQQFPLIVNELKKPEPNISLISRIFFNEINKISSNYELYFLKDQTIPNRNKEWLIKQMLSLKKTIYIENTENLNSYYKPIQNVLFTNYEREYKTMLKTKTEEDIMNFFETIQKKDIRNQINSYIISPIFLFDSIYGYLYLDTTFVDRRKIYFEDAIKISMITKAISYAITKRIIYKNYYLEPSILVKNISLSGILLKINSKTLYEFLIENDILRITIEIKNQILNFIAVIVRIFATAEDEFYAALEFVEFLEDSYYLLENYLFSLQSKKGATKSPLTTEFRE